MARKLTKLDEWPLHQTIDTFDSVATASQNWSDGFWNCVGDPEGKVNLITAIRFYQNTNVADGYACVSLDDGKQYNLRCSRVLRPRIDEEKRPVEVTIEIETGPRYRLAALAIDYQGASSPPDDIRPSLEELGIEIGQAASAAQIG